MQRYFVNNKLNNNHFIIEGGDVHHIKNVMRMNVGDNVICIYDNFAYYCVIEDISDKVLCKILEKIKKNTETNGHVSIAHGLVRRDKCEEVIRRLTELGCYEYIPLVMKRSIVKLEKNNDFKMERYQKIIKEASEQSQRNIQMRLSPVMKMDELLANIKQYDLLLLADANEDNYHLSDLNINLSNKNILVVIGPEGGFDDSEKALLVNNGFKVVSFGNRVLRTETAPLYAMSVLGYLLGDIDED